MHDLLEAEESFHAGGLWGIICWRRVVRVAVVWVEELNCAKAAFVDIKVDIALLEIRRDGFPDASGGVMRLNGTPGRETKPAAVVLRGDKEEVE